MSYRKTLERLGKLDLSDYAQAFADIQSRIADDREELFEEILAEYREEQLRVLDLCLPELVTRLDGVGSDPDLFWDRVDEARMVLMNRL